MKALGQTSPGKMYHQMNHPHLPPAGTWFLPCILGLLLAVSSFSAEPGTVPTGVTVLVHGYTPQDGRTNPPFEYWGGDRGQNFAMLLRRFGWGLVWEYNPSTGTYQNISASRTESGAYRIPQEGWTRAFAGEQILLFDWTNASDEKEAGQAEAAADALFASLMRFEVNGERIIASNPYRAVRPIRFVAHSRGTVVASETIQRLGRFNIQVASVTYLDIHDFGQPSIPNDEFFHDPAVQVWDNVDYAEVFFQENPAGSPVSCFPNPAGRPLEHLPPGPLQHDVTADTTATILECDLGSRPHSEVKGYYWQTVDPGSIEDEGFNYWWSMGGYGQKRDRSIFRSRCVVQDDALEFVWGRDLSNDRSFWDRNDVPPILFNGDFDLADLDRGIGELAGEGNSLAGWSYFGGGGRADINPEVLHRAPGEQIGNSYLALQGGALKATHNRFYLPTTAREIRFAISVPFVPVTPLIDHTLEVRIGNRLLRRFTVAETDGFTARTVNLLNHPDLLGGVNTLTFELFTGAGAAGLTARAHIDNVNIVADSLGWIDSVTQNAEGEIEIHWMCWPSGTFYLQSRSAIHEGAWSAVTHNSIPATAGTFTIPAEEGGRYFRGRIVPAR